MSSQSPEQVQPHEMVWTLAAGVVPARCLHVIAELGVADELGDRSLTAEELASRCGADAGALFRALRLLAAHGIFERDGDGFRQSPASELLRTEHPMSMRPHCRMMNTPHFVGAFANMGHSVSTGRPGVEVLDPRGVWPYLRDHPDEAAIFDQTMTAQANLNTAAIVAAYDFSEFATIADIGGSRGHLVRAVLDATPGARGVLFDLPTVIDALDFEDERLQLHAGDFFTDPLPAADVYMLMQVIHDWSDDECVAILQAVRHAAAPGARVLLLEAALPEDGFDPILMGADLIMLSVAGGKERTLDELKSLLERAGFGDIAAYETQSSLTIVEASVV